MYQLVYISFASEEFDENTDIEKILESSQKNNPALDITGMLLLKGSLFIQCIEGPIENIENLFDKISQDPRHRKVKILVKSKGNERIFGNWTMAYKKLEDLDLEKINEIIPWKELMEKAENEESIDNKTILKIMKKLALKI